MLHCKIATKRRTVGVRELWDVYGEDYKRIEGRVAVRGKHDLGQHEYHLVVYAWIISDDGKVIISRRQKGKSFGGSWECTGGCVKQGEASKEAVLREVREELGVVLPPESGSLYKRYKRRFPIGAKAICDVWVFRCNVDPADITPQKDEVSEVKIISCEELLEMQNKGVFRKRYGYIEEMLNELKLVF